MDTGLMVESQLALEAELDAVTAVGDLSDAVGLRRLRAALDATIAAVEEPGAVEAGS